GQARGFWWYQDVAEHDNEWFIAYQFFCTQDGVTKAKWLCLTHRSIRCHRLQFRKRVKMIFDAAFTATRHEDYIFNACSHRFFYDVLQRRFIDKWQHL